MADGEVLIGRIFKLLFSFKHFEISMRINFNLWIIHNSVFKFPEGMSFAFFGIDVKLNCIVPYITTNI